MLVSAPEYFQLLETNDDNDQDLEGIADKQNSSDPLPENIYIGEHDDDKESHVAKNIVVLQAFPSLVISLVGLVAAGMLMDEFQQWDIFLKSPELFILILIVLNLKGNLEMNLAARLSTSANLGDLDYKPSRRALITGNLVLLQVQAIVAGAIAGIASFALGLITQRGHRGYHESMYIITSSMVAASTSSAVLGAFMCAVVIASRWLRIDPDNIACPLASSTGDIVTLVLLAGSANVLQQHVDTILSTVLFFFMCSLLPFLGWIVWRNKHVKDLLFTGWSPLICAMIISSLAGVVLEEYVEQYKGLALMTPVLIGLAGNLGSIYASRISTCLHCEKRQNHQVVQWTLILMNIPIQFIFFAVIWGFRMGSIDYNIWLFITYFIDSMICTFVSLKIARTLTLLCWKMGYDPDNYVIPYLTASIDVVGTALLVISFSWLTSTGASDMSIKTAAATQ